MYKHITRFFFWLLPILKQSAIQILAEEIHKIAYPGRIYRRPMVSPYQRPLTRRQAIVNVGRAVREANAFNADSPNAQTLSPFHDVLLVAFDIRGRSAEDVHEWLMEQMPPAGEHGDKGEIELDSWWVANDDRFDGSDTNSAVFVEKGKQAEARTLLRRCGLAN